MQVLVPAHHIQHTYGVPVSELARWRRQGIGPAYYRPAPRIIRYAIDDTDAWFHNPANAHLHDFPSQQTHAHQGASNQTDNPES